MKLSVVVAILAVLVAAPGACDKGSKPTESRQTQPPAVVPNPAPAIGVLTVDGTEACPPEFQYKFVGTVKDPNGVPVSRPLHMKVDQFNREGDPGTIRDNGQDKPGVGYTRTGRSPLAHCMKVNPGDFIHAVGTFSIQTNAVGWKVSCKATLSDVFVMDTDEDTIEAGEGIQEAIATCDIRGIAP